MLESRIVDGYRGNLYEIVECFRQDDLLLLGKVESEWWSKPAYIHIPQEVVEDWKAQLIEEAGSDQPSSPAEIPQEVVEALEEAGSDQPSSPAEIPQEVVEALEEAGSDQPSSPAEIPQEVVDGWSKLKPGTNLDVVVLDLSQQQSDNDCIKNFSQSQFVVDQRIMQIANADTQTQ
ncbi:MAG: hypothetical protein OXC82_05770 [Rhodobacteraceae bacterium]|nr:hypothetical protein [Paracoccaceae bacterium]